MRIGLFAGSLAGCSQSPILLNDGGKPPDPSIRSFSQYWQDERIEDQIRDRLNQDDSLRAAYIQITSYHGVVLLTGQVPTSKLKSMAGNKAKPVKGIERLANQIQVAPPRDWNQRFSDDMIAQKLKTQLFFNSQVPSGRIKIIVSMSRVYCMGRVTHSEAKTVLHIAARVNGVKEVVNLFQYI